MAADSRKMAPCPVRFRRNSAEVPSRTYNCEASSGVTTGSAHTNKNCFFDMCIGTLAARSGKTVVNREKASGCLGLCRLKAGCTSLGTTIGVTSMEETQVIVQSTVGVSRSSDSAGSILNSLRLFSGFRKPHELRAHTLYF